MSDRFFRLLSLSLWALVGASEGRAGATNGMSSLPADAAALRRQLADHLAQPRFQHAQWGALIVSLDTGATLFAANADKLLLPASNAKLYTAALALDRLGEDFRIRTSLYARSRPDRRGVLRSDIVLYGRGDPSFAARCHEGDLERALASLVDAVEQAGVREVRGDLVADESYFRGPPFGSGWQWDDLEYYYGAEVSALSLNDNALELAAKPGARAGDPVRITVPPPASRLVVSNLAVTVASNAPRAMRVSRPLLSPVVLIEGRLPLGDKGQTETISVPDPARWFGRHFQTALGRRGIKFTGGLRVVSQRERRSAPLDTNALVELGGANSPPLRELVREMMKPSQNLHAQLFLLQVGVAEESTRPVSPAATGAGRGASMLPTTEAAGLKALNTFLHQAGIASDEVALEEGSGLSRHDLVTPAATVALLRYMDRHPAGQAFRESLPIAAVDGTLKNRMTGTPAAGNARAKTGTLSQVNTLAGYVTTLAKERLVFALMLNNYRGSDVTRPARVELDEIVVLLSRLPWTSAPHE